MKKSIIVLLSILFNSVNAQPVKFEEEFHQLNLIYWNDNFLFEDLIEDFIYKGKDDYVTGSLSVEYLTGQKSNYRTCNCEFNILTNKSENYRTDLLTFLFSRTKATSNGKFSSGLGFVGRGNLGGSEIQNYFHDLFGWRRIDLLYLSTLKFGLLVRSEVQYDFLKKPTYSVSGNLSLTFVSAAGPSKFFPNLSVNCYKYLNVQLNFGYVDYYKKDKWLKPMFKRGFSWKLSASKEMFGKFGFGLWLTRGLYGIEEESHYGLDLSFR